MTKVTNRTSENPSSVDSFSLDIEEIGLRGVGQKNEISEVLELAQTQKANLTKEVISLRREFNVDPDEENIKPIATQEQFNKFMTDSFERLNKATIEAQDLENTSHRKTPEEAQDLLETFVREQDRFLINMKIAQVYQTQFVINNCETIGRIAQSGANLASIPQHTEALRKNIEHLDAMPPMKDFEATHANISRMVGMHAALTLNPQVQEKDDGIVSENTTSRVMAAGISQAFRANFQVFRTLLPKEIEEEVAKASSEKEMQDVYAQADEPLEHMAQETNFTNLVSRHFQESFIIAKAIDDGKVNAKANLTSQVISGLNTAMGMIDPGIIGPAASVLLTVAEFANTSREIAKTKNAANFATLDEDKVKTPEELAKAKKEVETLRREIVENIARKTFQSYSLETDGKSPMGLLSDKGQEKFAGALVERMMANISTGFTPPTEEVPLLNEDAFKKNTDGYRDNISKQYGVTVDPKRLAEDKYFSDVSTKINNAMYADFISDHLISSVVHGKVNGIIPQSLAEAATAKGFQGDELTDPKGSKITFDGLVSRVGVIDSEGNRYLAEGRQGKEGAGGESKYFFRKADREEEAALKAGAETLKGYVAYTPRLEEFAAAKEKALTALNNNPALIISGNSDSEREAALQKMIETYKTQKAENPNLKPLDFLKDEKSSGILTGGKTTGMFVKTRDENRIAFNGDEKNPEQNPGVKSPLLALLAAADKITLADIQRPKEEAKEGVEQESKLSAAIPDVAEVTSRESKSVPKKEDPKAEVNPEEIVAEVAKMAREQFAKTAQKIAAENAAQKVQIMKEQKDLAAKLEAAQKDLAEKQKPRPIKSFFAKIGFPIKVPTVQDIKNVQKLIDGIESTRAGNEKRMKDLDGKSANANSMVDGLDEVRSQKSLGRTETDTSDLISKAGDFADNIEIDKRVIGDVQSEIQTKESEAARQEAFFKTAAESLLESKVLAKAKKDGRVDHADDNVDKGLEIASLVLGNLPFGQVTSFGLTVAKQLNVMNKDAVNNRVVDFSKKGGEDIAQSVMRKIYDRYTQKIDGVAPLDGMSEEKQQNFVRDAVGNVMDQAGKTKLPSFDSVPEEKKLDQDKFKVDVGYREKMTQKYGVEIRTDSQEDLKAAAAKINGQIYIDHVSDQMVDSFAKGRGAAVLESAKVAKPLTDKAALDAQKANIVVAVDLKQFKSAPQGLEGEAAMAAKSKAVEDLMLAYKERKAENPKLTHEDFLKDSDLVAGTSKTTMFVVKRSPEREEFNKVKPAFEALLAVADKMTVEEIKGRNDSRESSVNESRSSNKEYASISEPAFSPERLKELAKYKDVGKRTHISEILTETRKTDYLSASEDRVGDMISSVMPESESKAASVKSRVTESGVEVKSEVTEARGKASQKAEEFTDKKADLLQTLTADKLKPEIAVRPEVLECKTSAEKVDAALTGFVEGYHVQVMAGANKEELTNFAKENLPVASNNKIIAKMCVDLAVQHSEAQVLKLQANEVVAKTAAGVVNDATEQGIERFHLSKADRSAIEGIEEDLEGKFGDTSSDFKTGSTNIQKIISERDGAGKKGFSGRF